MKKIEIASYKLVIFSKSQFYENCIIHRKISNKILNELLIYKK